VRVVFGVVGAILGDKIRARVRLVTKSSQLLEGINPDQMFEDAQLGGTMQWSDDRHSQWCAQLEEDCKQWPGIDLSPPTAATA
jgi:hypothetical protein